MQKYFLVWAATLAALPALAQSPGVTADPMDAKGASRMPQYRSAFADYRGWREPGLTNWRSANDEAGALGGHMGQVRGHDRGHSSKAMPAPIATPALEAEPSK